MVLPLGLLHTSEGHPIVIYNVYLSILIPNKLVELKNGETYNGHLVASDNFMNLTLREVILTSPDGDRFWRLQECYVRGSNIKYIRVPDEIVNMVKENVSKKKASRENRNENSRGSNNNRGRGGRGRGMRSHNPQ